MKQQRAYREQLRKGFQQKDLEPEKTEEDIDRIRRNKLFLDDRREYHENKRPDNFYRKIPDEQKKVLLEKFKTAWGLKAYTFDKMQKADLERIFDQYLEKSNQFNNEYRTNERIRATAHAQLTETEVMMHFMVDLNSAELAEAAKPLPITESKVEQ